MAAGGSRTELAAFTGWLTEHDVDGFIGEVGWPDDTRGDADAWNAAAAAWFADAQRTFRPARVYGLIVVAGAISFAVHLVVTALESYAFRYRPSD